MRYVKVDFVVRVTDEVQMVARAGFADELAYQVSRQFLEEWKKGSVKTAENPEGPWITLADRMDD